MWSKLNKEISYKQGMNEIIGTLLIAIYPYYGNYDKHIDNSSKEKYFYIFDESYLEADLYWLFDSLMRRGIKDIYFMHPKYNKKVINHDNNNKINKVEPFSSNLSEQGKKDNRHNKDDQEIKDTLPIEKRITKIFDNYLKVCDKELYEYLTEIQSEPTLFLQRWLKCILIREFHPITKVINLWDAILAYDMHQILNLYNYQPYCVLIDYICIHMMKKIRSELINKDINFIYQKLLYYPHLADVSNIVKNSIELKEIIKAKEKENVEIISKNMKNKIDNKIRKTLSLDNIAEDSRNILQKDSDVLHKSEIIENRISLNSIVSNTSVNTFCSEGSNNSRCSHISKRDSKKLEHIYLKYKNMFTLKDSKDFLKILIKLKTIK